MVCSRVLQRTLARENEYAKKYFRERKHSFIDKETISKPIAYTINIQALIWPYVKSKIAYSLQTKIVQYTIDNIEPNEFRERAFISNE